MEKVEATKATKDTARFYLNGESNISSCFQTILLLDDEKDLCNLYAELITDHFPNTVVIVTQDPVLAKAVYSEIFIDIAIIDMNLGKNSRGDHVIEDIKIQSPYTYNVIITGHTDEYLINAGYARPDKVWQKKNDVNPLFKIIKNGLDEVDKTILDLFGRLYNPPQDKVNFVDLDWRIKRSKKDLLGFTPDCYMLSRKIIKAIAGFLITDLSKDDICVISGFSSIQRMNDKVKWWAKMCDNEELHQKLGKRVLKS